MTAPTTDAIASPRPSRQRRSAVALVREGLSDLLGRRRLTRYLVGADIQPGTYRVSAPTGAYAARLAAEHPA